ncbi:MAG: 50S ribosomal protein L21e [Nitrososphaerota archaeon]|nr:50S ribosomal protein L21e [Candidatus Calditenuaceae archaeon]MDW8074065.1 50S ribosomal protein L21e [Nitrososphaerota archaeon]
MTRHSGYRHRTRRLFTRGVGARSGPNPDVYLQAYEIGQKVAIDIDPSTQKGMPHKRYQGRVGRIVEKRGRGYIVEVELGSKLKRLSVLPEHLKPLPQG